MPPLLVGLLPLVLGVQRLASAEPDATGDSQPAGLQRDSAAALVKDMYDSRAWVDGARTFSIRIERIIAYTEKGLRDRAKQPSRRNRAADPILKVKIGEEEWAWDQTRIRCWNQWQGGNVILRLFDGKLGVERSQSVGGKHYESVLHDKPAKYFDVWVGRVWAMPWGPGDSHRFWWLPIDVEKTRADRYLAPKDFELDGEEVINGRDCCIALSRAGRTRLHIGKADGRLYRRTWYVVSPATPGYDHLALCRQIGGERIKSLDDWKAYFETLEPTGRQAVWHKLAKAQFEFTRKGICETLEDYREVAPGCWLPFRQTCEIYNTRAPDPFLSMKTKVTVEQVQVNQPLADELFDIECKDALRLGGE